MKNIVESWLEALLSKEGDNIPPGVHKQVIKAMSHMKAESGIHNIVKSSMQNEQRGAGLRDGCLCCGVLKIVSLTSDQGRSD